MGNFKISIVIPVKNGGATLERCLQSIIDQTIVDDIEIIVLNSMSTDNSMEIARRFNARIIDVPAGAFNHGLTRNLGTLHASGNLLFYTVQDAWLSATDMMEKMSAHFNDPVVQAVVGHQAVPWGHADKNPAYWFKRYSEPVVETRYFPNSTFTILSPKRQFQLSSWDNVNAMYRKTVLLDIPFIKTNFSEDWLWANDALQQGIKLLRDPSLVVYHYHHMLFSYTFKTKFIITYHFFQFFNQVPLIPWSPMNALRATYSIVKRKEVSIFKKPYWIMHNLFLNLSVFLSVLVFKTAWLLDRNKLLNKVYGIICREVPQGKVKVNGVF